MNSLSARLFTVPLATALLCGVVLGDSPTESSDIAGELRAIRAQMAQQEARLQSQDQVIQQQQFRLQLQEGEIQQLRGEAEQNWLNERRVEEVKLLVREVLHDAETRASLLEDGIYAGHDGKKFFLRSADDSFLMNIGGYVQVRYIANFRDDIPGGTDMDGDGDVDATDVALSDEGESGFQLRRVKLQFGGHVGSPKITYYIQLAGNRDTATVELEDAYLTYRFSDALALRGGQFKPGFLLEEEDVGATRQLTIERSLVNAIFTLNYAQGVELLIDPTDWIHIHASINDGARSGVAGGTGNDFQNDTADFALSSRVELKLAGDWKQKADFVAWSAEPTALFLGGGIHYEVAETGDSQAASPGADDFFMYTVDAHFKSKGLGAFAAFVGRHIVVTDGAATGDLDDFGIVAQAGYMVIPDKLQPFVRYEWIGPDDDRGLNDINLVTAGVNYFFRGHATKFTVDVVWALDELNLFAFTRTPSGAPSATSGTGLGLLPDAPGNDNQAALRAQFQVMF